MKNNYSADYVIYLNHMNNTGGTPKEKWGKVLNSIAEPMALIPLVIAITWIPFILITENEFARIFLTAISSVGLGISMNYFTFYYNKQTEYQTLKTKAETTARNLNLAIKSLLRKDEISNEDRNTIDLLTNTIDFWKDYYANADTANVKILRKLREEIKEERNGEMKSEKLTLFTKIETPIGGNGVDHHTPTQGNKRQ
ncbi:MAG: hypothetical protein K2X86_15780 [Cytophagaceae bacterium]|nr:hypothetical protein [Cytophagaceae bacterium]